MSENVLGRGNENQTDRKIQTSNAPKDISREGEVRHTPTIFENSTSIVLLQLFFPWYEVLRPCQRTGNASLQAHVYETG